MVKIVVDTDAWIEIFLGSAKGRAAKAKIEDAESVFTPDIVLAEVARKYLSEGIAEAVVQKRLATILGASEAIRTDQAVAVESAKAHAELDAQSREAGISRPSLFDAMVLAAARVNQGKVLTGDRHFRDLPETVWLG
ncbi:MAG: PIN domain-containing protein [Nitrososphaerales archaeon]